MAFNEWAKSVAGTAREHLGVAAVSVGVIVAMIAVAAAGSFGGCGRQDTASAADPAVATFPVTAASVAAPQPAEKAGSPGPPPGNPIIVYVTGAVKRPGVYTLASDARLYHAIRAAGGFKANAVTDALNLADRAQDGDQLCVPSRQQRTKATTPATVPREVALTPRQQTPLPALPPLIRKTSLPAPVLLPPTEPDAAAPTVTVIATPPAPGRVLGVPAPPTGEPEPVPPPQDPTAARPALGIASLPPSARKPERAAAKTSTKFKNPGDGIVHINSATAAELEQLPRCGPAMSAKILAYRAQIGGRFTDTKQLMDVKGCGEKTFEKWTPFLAL